MSAFKDWLNGLTGKTTPVDADEMYLRDSVGAASNKVTWANLKATLLAYFDTAYLKLTGGTLAGGTVTASAPVLTTTQTWNNAAVTFSGKVTNITNTASAAASLIEDWQVGGVSKFNVSVLGAASVGDGGASPATGVPGIAFIGAPQVGFRRVGTVGAIFTASGADIWFTAASNLNMRNNGSYSFSSTSDPTAAADVNLYRDGAGILAQRNGTNAQTYRTYGTYTDASNYRRVALAMTTAGVATLAPEGAGTGASGNVLHISGLPTSNPGAGILWNDSGTVKVGT